MKSLKVIALVLGLGSGIVLNCAQVRAEAPPKSYEANATTVVDGTAYQPTEKQLHEWNTPIKGFHPIKRITRPLWKLRQSTSSLEQRLIGLEQPMNKLQPSVAGLEKRLETMDKSLAGLSIKMDSLDTNLPILNDGMNQVTEQLKHVRTEVHSIVGIRRDLAELNKGKKDLKTLSGQIKTLGSSLKELQQPMLSMATPLNQIHYQLLETKGDFTNMDSELDKLRNQIATMNSQIADLKGSLGQLKEPVLTINRPLNQVHSDLAELNGILHTLLLAVLAVGVVGLGGGIALFLQMRKGTITFPKLKVPDSLPSHLSSTTQKK